MTALSKKQTFLMKILIRAKDKRLKKLFLPGSPGRQSQKPSMGLFFDRKEFALSSFDRKEQIFSTEKFFK